MEVQHKLVDASVVPLQYEVERFKKEVDVLAAHSKWLEEENARASQDLAKTKAQHSQVMIDLREALDQAAMERDESKSEVRRLAMKKDELESKAEKVSKEFRDYRLESIAASEASEKELHAERKLVDLQKEQMERIMKRHERLEQELNGLREVAAKASADADKEFDVIRDEIQREANKVLEEQQAVFKREIATLKNEISSREHMGSPLKSRRLLTMDNSEEPMGLTDLYARLNETEDELLKARAECEKHRSYVQRVVAEVAAKTPQMLRQRKEYEMALERTDEMQSRLRDALQETKRCRDEATELREELGRMHRRNEELQGESKDLAKHVQALLASKAGADVRDGIPTSIAEVQEQNQQLLGEQRRLSTHVKELQLQLSNDRTVTRLQKAEQELETLQGERERQETFVSSIAQQRDLYRALLSNQDGAAVDFANTELVVAQQTQEVQAVLERCKTLEQELAEARAAVTALKGDKDVMSERIERYTVHTKELTVAIDKLQNELTTASANAARDKAESSYYRDKCARAEQNLEDGRGELNRHSQLRKETNELNARLHQQLSEARANVSKLESDFVQAETKLRLAKTQEEAAKSAEARLLGEVLQLRSEVARQGSLSETIRRIEASLTAQNEEDKEKLREEAGCLKQLLENEVMKSGIEVENLRSRIKELEMTAAEAERKKDQAMEESIAAKGEALAATTDRQKSVAQIARLELELSSAREKLGATTSDPAEVALQSKVESLTQQLEEAKAEISTIKKRAGNFETMAKASERELTLLTQASDDFKKGKHIEILELQTRIDVTKEEGKKKDEVISELTRDLSSLRGEQETAEAVLKVRIVGLESEVATAKKDAEDAIAKTEELASEVQRYRDDALKAQSNYERELDLHSEANKELRAAREEIASEQRLRRSADMRFESAQVEIAEKEKQLDSEMEKITNSMKEMEESLKLTRNQNDLLLSQLTSLGDQVEKAQSDRIEVSTGDALSSDEVETLRKEVSDLREVVKFLRSEREMNDAKIDVARRTAEREKAVSAVTLRSLDEARAELKILREQISSTAAAPSDNAGDSLKKGEEQLALLQESNRLLRSEGKKLQESLASTLAELDEQLKLAAPFEQKQMEFSVEKAALVAEKCSLQRELESWKERVQSLVSKFNQIDPEEHNRIVKHAQILESEVKDLKAQKEATEKEGTNAKAIVSKLNKELAQQKAFVQKQQSLLKKMQTDKETATVTSSATAVITKENAMLKEKLQKMDAESKSNQTELKGASDRIEMLKSRMRQFQKTIGEQRQKISDLESAAATPAPVTEVNVLPASSQPVPLPRKSAAPAESASGETKEEQPVAPKDSAPTVDKEAPAAVTEVAKESLPSAPAGGFKFGPSSTSATAKKEETQKRAAPMVVVPADSKSTSSAPPAKKAKVADKGQDDIKDKEEPAKVESPLKQVEGKAEDKAYAGEKSKGDEKVKAARVLKDQLMRKREALVQRKKKLEEATAKQHAQQSPAKEEQLPGTKATSSVAQEVLEEAAVVPAAIEANSEPELENKEGEKPGLEAIAEVKAVAKAVAHAAKAAVEAKAGELAPLTEKSDLEAPKPLSFASSPFGNPIFGSGTSATLGSTSFGKPPTGGGLVFGTSPSILGFGSAAAKDTPSATSSVFLDMKPPSSTAPPFTFGSTSITLPTPSIAAPPSVDSPFGAFGGTSSFGGGAAPNPAAMPLFGTSTCIKRAAPEPSISEEQTAKIARVEEGDESAPEGE